MLLVDGLVNSAPSRGLRTRLADVRGMLAMNPTLPQPKAVFFDFGGVLADARRRPEGPAEAAAVVVTLLERCGLEVDAGRIERDVIAGSEAFEAWKSSQSRMRYPAEPTHRAFWSDFVTADWPRRARIAVDAHAAELCTIFEAATVDRPVKAGADRVLEWLAAAGIPTALACNTLSGGGTRRLISDYGFSGLLTLELYSDELGVRKPNPRIFEPALVALDVAPRDVWYVGDKYDRDDLAARRADLGAAILMTQATADAAPTPDMVPDAVVTDPAALLRLIEAHVPGRA